MNAPQHVHTLCEPHFLFVLSQRSLTLIGKAHYTVLYAQQQFAITIQYSKKQKRWTKKIKAWSKQQQAIAKMQYSEQEMW